MLVCFGLLMLAVTEAVERLGPSVLLGEGGLLEILQLLLLGVATLASFCGARWEGRGSALQLLGALLLLAFVRELDGPLDAVWHGFWKVPAAVLAVISFRRLWPRRSALVRSLRRHASAPHAGLFLGAFAVLFLHSRLLGQQALWRSVLGENFIAAVPRLVEETSELAGYGLMVLGGLQAHGWVRAAGARCQA